MDKNLKVLIRNNFGNNCVYPYCEFTRMITEITGTKTLTDSTIARLKNHGYSFKVVAEQQEI